MAAGHGRGEGGSAQGPQSSSARAACPPHRRSAGGACRPRRLFAFRDARMDVRGTVDTSADPDVRDFYRAVIPTGVGPVSRWSTRSPPPIACRRVQGFSYRGTASTARSWASRRAIPPRRRCPGARRRGDGALRSCRRARRIFDFGAARAGLQGPLRRVATDFVQAPAPPRSAGSHPSRPTPPGARAGGSCATIPRSPIRSAVCAGVDRPRTFSRWTTGGRGLDEGRSLTHVRTVQSRAAVPMALHIIKLCVGAESVEGYRPVDPPPLLDLAAAGLEPEQTHTTRMYPKRASEIVGEGSLYLGHQGRRAGAPAPSSTSAP